MKTKTKPTANMRIIQIVQLKNIGKYVNESFISLYCLLIARNLWEMFSSLAQYLSSYV